MSDFQMRPGALGGPLVIVGIGESELYLQKATEAGKGDSMAMLYDLASDRLLGELKPLNVWSKHVFEVEAVAPPIPWTEGERRYRVLTYRLLRGAREAANGED